MTTYMIFSSIIVMGFACSLGCGTVTTPFILGSLLGEGENIKQSRNAMLIFSLGKVLALGAMGLLSSLFGSTVLSYVETIYPNSTIWIVRFITILFGVWLIYSVFRKSPCANCSSCKSAPQAFSGIASKPPSKKYLHKGFYFTTGALYSTIPCGPLVTTLTYASTMTPFLAVLLLVVFGIVNSIIPVFGLASIVGLANTEFKRDAPTYIKYIKIVGGIILILAAIFRV